MVQLDEYRQQLAATITTLKEAGESLDLDGLRKEKEALEAKMSAPDFWDDVDNANKVNQRIKLLNTKFERYSKLLQMASDIEVLIELADEAEDESMIDEIASEYRVFQEKVEELKLETLLKGEYDASNAVLSLHAGAGGTEAQDWVSLLYRMYLRYCDRMGYTVRVLDLLDGDEAGIKSVTFEVDGENAYGYLKAEKGVHRLVRISPFDSSGRRHTSFASLDVTPIFDDDRGDIKIDPDDLRVDTYRASGAGGQHVNKTSSAIRITHIPTGIVVQCQNERSQIQNRETAMRMLRGKLLELQDRARMEQMAEIKGEMKKIEWGSQIRSYVFQPYTMVKDHRTGAETGNIQAVMDGAIDQFVQAFLVQS
ncbi:MAG: peptide chain release factor 2 [Clostridia bacterium]|nr:peptide chain release factor 2 [Clostridia bacterium]